MIGYKTVSSNQALIITGPNLGSNKDTRLFEDKTNGRQMLIIRGGGYFVKPFQNATPVDLRAIQTTISTPKIYTVEGVPIIVDSTVTVKIAEKNEDIANYAEQFLGKDPEQIKSEISNVLAGNLRAIVAKLNVEKVNNDREAFIAQVKKIAQEDLANMGFKIVSMVIDDVRDADPRNGYLVNLGRARIAEVDREAAIAEYEADSEKRISRATNDQKAKAQEAQRSIEIAESEKERDIRQAQIKAETERARAKAEQAYALEKAQLDQKVKEEELKVTLIENNKRVEMQRVEKERRQVNAETEALETTVNAEAEAQKRQIDGAADAKLLEIKADAEAKALKLKTEAEAEAVRIKAEAEANAKKQAGLAEAEVALKKGQAEAEAKELMANSLSKYGKAAMTEMIIKMLPEFAKAIAEPLANISEVKVIDMGGNNDGQNGVQSVAKNTVNLMTTVQNALQEATGVNLKEMMETNAARGRNLLNNSDSVDVKDTELAQGETAEDIYVEEEEEEGK